MHCAVCKCNGGHLTTAHACESTHAAVCAGIMAVITLSTALVFALVVFPAMCVIAPLHCPDTASLHALFSGRFRAFFGLNGRDCPRPGESAVCAPAGNLSSLRAAAAPSSPGCSPL
jgi:hypothetical protein